MSGAAGIGKTRLLQEFGGQAKARGARVWTGRCLPAAESLIPYVPVVDLLHGIAAEIGVEELRALAAPTAGWLSVLAPEFAIAAAAADAVPPPPAGRGMLHAAWWHLIERIAVEPAALVLEDLHWADTSTRELIAGLASAQRRGRLLVVGTYRDDELSASHSLRTLVIELVRSGAAGQLRLGPLDLGETTRQIADLLPGELIDLHRGLAKALESRVTEQTGASTLAEIAHHWLASHDAEHALPACYRAGVAALRTLANAEARRQFEHAIDLWEQVPQIHSRVPWDLVELYEHAAAAAFAEGAVAEAARLTQHAADRCDAGREPVRKGLLCERTGRYLKACAGNETATLQALEEAVRLVPDKPSAARARVLAGLAEVHAAAGRHRESQRWADRALQMARQIGSPAEERGALTVSGLNLARLGSPAEGIALADGGRCPRCRVRLRLRLAACPAACRRSAGRGRSRAGGRTGAAQSGRDGRRPAQAGGDGSTCDGVPRCGGSGTRTRPPRAVRGVLGARGRAVDQAVLPLPACLLALARSRGAAGEPKLDAENRRKAVVIAYSMGLLPPKHPQ